jgi:ketosteroid isomerase-like protein
MSGPGKAEGEHAMNEATRSNGEIVRALLAAQVRGELEAARALIAPDVVYHLRAYQKTIRGIDDFLALLNGYYGRSKNFRSDVLRLVEQGEWVALQGHESYEMDGAAVAFDYASWVRVVDGRIVEWNDYFDSRIVGKQLKAKPGAA